MGSLGDTCQKATYRLVLLLDSLLQDVNKYNAIVGPGGGGTLNQRAGLIQPCLMVRMETKTKINLVGERLEIKLTLKNLHFILKNRNVITLYFYVLINAKMICKNE